MYPGMENRMNRKEIIGHIIVYFLGVVTYIIFRLAIFK